MNKKILLVQPVEYTFYPLVFMKISSYHKNLGDTVETVVGRTFGKWDRVYITTLLTVDYQKYIDTIDFYQNLASEVIVGGPAGTMLADKFYRDTGIMPHKGLVPEFEQVQLDHTLYYKPEFNYSQAYSTKGCNRSCPFCLVRQMEPEFVDKVDDIAGQIDLRRKDLKMLDNNVLLSSKLPEIVEELVGLGFGHNARPARKVDFNQGIDCRLFTLEKAKIMRRLNIRPLRFALDSCEIEDKFAQAIENAVKVGFRDISTYMLFNFYDVKTRKGDRPEDLYSRLSLVSKLSRMYGVRISVFPMRYLPLTALDRKYTSPLWDKALLRGFQLMRNVCRGGLPAGKDSFNAVIGRSLEEFMQNLQRTDEQVYKKSAGVSDQPQLWDTGALAV